MFGWLLSFYRSNNAVHRVGLVHLSEALGSSQGHLKGRMGTQLFGFFRRDP